MKARIFIFIFIGALAGQVKSNAAESSKGTGIVQGQVIDHETQEPIPFASIALYAIGNAEIATGAISNEHGEFWLEGIPYGSYTLKASFVGYKPMVIEKIELNRNNRQYDAAKISMKEEALAIEGAVVTQERLKGTEEIDRTVYTINDDIRKASSSGLDALKYIPSVSVDFQQNVSVEGQTDILFYVDGVQRSKDFVAQLAPELINKVEVHTNPSVKYEADVSSVIHIILKKERKGGIYGSVKVPFAHPKMPMLNPKASLEYGNQKFRIYASDQAHIEQFEAVEILRTTYMDPIEPYDYHKISEGTKSWRRNTLNYGVDYFINDKTSLNFLGEWVTSNSLSKGYFTRNELFSGTQLLEYYESDQDSYDKNSDHFFSVYLNQKLREKDELSIELSYHNQDGEAKNEYLDYIYDVNDLSEPIEILERGDLVSNLQKASNVKVDYSFVAWNIKHEAGFKTGLHQKDNKFSDEIKTSENKNWQDQFIYDEIRLATYYSLAGSKNQLSYQIGTRIEYSGIEMDDSLSRTYSKLLPNINLGYTIQEKHKLKLSFRRKLIRPQAWELRPFERWMDSLHYRKGNPDLKPAIENRVEFAYSRNFGSNFLSPKLYFRFTENAIQDVSYVSNEGITEINKANVGKDMEYGLGINAAFLLWKKWRISSNMALYNQEVQVETDGLKYDESNWAFRFTGQSMYMLPKDYSLIAFWRYQTPTISYQRTHYREFLILFGASKQFSQKAKLQVMYNPFIPEYTFAKVKTHTDDYSEHWEGNLETRNWFNIEFTYNFGIGKKAQGINRAADYEKGSQGGAL